MYGVYIVINYNDLVNKVNTCVSCHDMIVKLKCGLFEENTEFSQQSFVRATEWVNEKHLLPQFNLVADVQEVDLYNGYKVSTNVCEMLSRGVAGVFGPHYVETSDHVQSICDAMEIPHIEMRWDSRQRRGSCLVNLYPHPSTFSKVFVDLVKIYEWDSFVLIYEDNNGLIRLNGLLSFYDNKGFSLIISQLDASGNYRPMLRRVKKTQLKNIVLDCSAEILPAVLLQAQQVGLNGPDYSYIITCLDFQTIDWEPFMHGETNITGIRMFDPTSKEVVELVDFWNERENDLVLTGEKVHVETALIHDSVMLYTKAVDQLLKSHELQPKKLSCDENKNWEHGYSIINYMKVTELNGLTGLIKFDNEGFRTDFSVEIVELSTEGLLKTGTWNATDGVNFTKGVEKETEHAHILDLRNVTFVVMITLVDPHVMLKEDTETLEGNAKYEGMGIDVIRELSLIHGFNYTFQEQKEGGSGNEDKKTGQWNGMIGEVIAGRAHLAIADITITNEREKVVDFTMPYMNLGISILYKKPKKSPSLFSFMDPFSKTLWKALFASYVGVSLLMYFLARISPKEWINPFPCIEDDEAEELENQFSLNNSFWFVTGVVMQQGSEVAPASMSTRMLAGVWSIFTLIIANSYTANLSASLSVEMNQDLFSDVKQLANQSPDSPVFVKYGAKIGGTTESFFQSSTHPTYQKMWHYMKNNYDSVMMKSNKDGVDKVLSNKEEFAFLMESASIEYEVQRKCTLQEVGSPLDSKGYGVVMPKNAWYRNILSSSVIKLQEEGKFKQLKKKWWEQKRVSEACDKKSGGGGDVEPLDLDNVGGVFLVLAFGLIFGSVLSVCELVYEIYMKKDREPFFKELWKELKFVASWKENVKRLKPLTEEENTSDEENADGDP